MCYTDIDYTRKEQGEAGMDDFVKSLPPKLLNWFYGEVRP